VWTWQWPRSTRITTPRGTSDNGGYVLLFRNQMRLCIVCGLCGLWLEQTDGLTPTRPTQSRGPFGTRQPRSPRVQGLRVNRFPLSDASDASHHPAWIRTIASPRRPRSLRDTTGRSPRVQGLPPDDSLRWPDALVRSGTRHQVPEYRDSLTIPSAGSTPRPSTTCSHRGRAGSLDRRSHAAS
jgi:hypothetical protein